MQEDLIDAIAALRPRVLSIVSKGVWHCTHHDRYADILLSGAILPEPSIDDADRWKTGAGPKHYPFARHLGGVSLFQFEPFEPDTYERDYPLSDWRTFVPCIKAWSATIWIEVDTSHLADFIPGPQLIQRWRDEKAYGHTIMPVIEAAHIGALPVTAFARPLVVSPADQSIRELTAGATR